MKQLVVLSGKGGTGKTTVASSLIRLAKNKAVADCDVDAPNLQLVFQPKLLASKPFYGIKLQSSTKTPARTAEVLRAVQVRSHQRRQGGPLCL